jgi:hypothetical protein
MDKTAVLLKYEGLLITSYDRRRKDKLMMDKLLKLISQASTDNSVIKPYQHEILELKDNLERLCISISIYESIIFDIRNIHSLT